MKPPLLDLTVFAGAIVYLGALFFAVQVRDMCAFTNFGSFAPLLSDIDEDARRVE